MVFQCSNCGYCCTSLTSQIGLTLGDLHRMSVAVGKSPLMLYKEEVIGLFPFGDVESNTLYDVDLGINLACKHWKNKRCTIYPSRPFNCRLFPHWIYSVAPKKDLPTIFDKEMVSYKHHIDEFHEDERPIYQQYRKQLEEIFLKESEISDKLLSELNMRWTIDLSKVSPSFFALIGAAPMHPKRKELEKIKHCIALIEQRDFSTEFENLQEKMKVFSFATADEINKTETILKQAQRSDKK